MYRESCWKIAGLALLALWVPARAQTSINGVRVYAFAVDQPQTPPGIQFTVDGQLYTSATGLLWPAGSKHYINSYTQGTSLADAAYELDGIYTNLNPPSTGHKILPCETCTPPGAPITADPSVTWIAVAFKTAYRLTLSIADCSDPKQPCFSPGSVQLFGCGGGTYQYTTQFYCKVSTPVQAVALPANGYVFTGWGPIAAPAASGGSATAPVISFTMNAPVHLVPIFQAATPVHVNVQSDPQGLQILADRTPVTAPFTIDWGFGSTHTIGAVPAQYDTSGRLWVFSSWSDGGAINHTIQMPASTSPFSITAAFVPGATVSVLTSPPGLSVTVDGAPSAMNHNFAWGGGTSHTISAPATQTDSQGRKYRFVSWSNGKPASFTYTMPEPPADDHLTATYQTIGQLTINSAPSGLPVQVDDSTCTTPCAIERPAGTSVKLAASGVLNATAGNRLVFQGWSDSSEAAHKVTVSADPATYTATYRVQNHLSLASDPPGGATFTTSPSSTDGFFDAGTLVSIAVNVAEGYRIVSWSGDLSGNARSAALGMDAPRSAVLTLNPVPAIHPLGVQNAAGNSGVAGMAPGSLISIFGANLAPDLLAGPANPLAQTLENVTVRIDDRFLPLVFASPGQINAQVPYGLDAGAHTLTVRWEGHPETSAPVTIVRNAPGLFYSMDAQQRPLGYFLHDDGSAITGDNPARPNELIRVLGTGLGPYQSAPPDGFVFDQSAGYTITDPVSIALGDGTTLNVVYAGRSGAGAGVDEVRFAAPANTTGSPFVQLQIQVNGVASNTVFLPVAQ